ncbi:MAG: 3-phosphoserine/phosphohydroxythreonine transaminase [Bacteroidetes bacterium]|nr:3-phosphoserine/phosphohydroxythreonine transaminase [Bacteroidota bacterium]
MKINFNPGPAALPQEVLQQASDAILNYNGTGLSILSIPHRGKLFAAILEESKQLVKELCRLDDNYEILWMHGGGRLQFSMVPMNFLAENDTAGYIDSGYWAHDAIEYAKYYGHVAVLASSEEKNYTELPVWPADIPSGLAYMHFTTNNTIYGTQWKTIPQTEVPLIADMSSDIFSREMNYTHCDMFYAVAQKNIGAVGATLVAIKKEMLSRIIRVLPPMLNYAAHVKANSVLNTSPIFSIYTALLMLRWTKQKTIAAIEKENIAKAKLLYDEIHRNDLFTCNIKHTDRSMMNICFTANQKEHERTFIDFCEERNITGIEGHRSVGAFRASLYNAITIKDVECLTAAMQEFESKYN